jgi:phage terminase large subunit GpA-like protein
MGWKKIRARNEVWDTIIYAITAMYFHNLQVWSDEAWDLYASELRAIANKR